MSNKECLEIENMQLQNLTSEEIHSLCSSFHVGYIYRITNNINGKTYIGQHFPNKNEVFLDYLGSGKLIRRAIEKTNPKNFSKTIITVGKTQNKLNYLERLFIFQERKNSKSEYNIADGGDGIGSDSLRKIWSEKELREKQSKNTKKIWEDKKYRKKVIESHKRFWTDKNNRIERSNLMKKKWSDPKYSLKQRAILKSPEIIEKISANNKITKNFQHDEIADRTQNQWHRINHSTQPRRTCKMCNKLKLSEPLNKKEIKEILSKTKRSLIVEKYNLTLNEVAMIRRSDK